MAMSAVADKNAIPAEIVAMIFICSCGLKLPRTPIKINNKVCVKKIQPRRLPSGNTKRSKNGDHKNFQV